VENGEPRENKKNGTFRESIG